MNDFETLRQIEINDLKLKLRNLQSEYDNYVKHMTDDMNDATLAILKLKTLFSDFGATLSDCNKFIHNYLQDEDK